LRKPDYPRPRTDQGTTASWSLGLMLCIYLAVLLMAQLMWQRLFLASQTVEDALACSNLAAAVIDWKELGNTGELVITDRQKAYQTFLSSLYENMELSDSGSAESSSLFEGNVTVEAFILYQVTSHGVYEEKRREDGSFVTEHYPIGTVYAPNGKKVEHTGVYSEISCYVKGVFGESYYAAKSKLVDVTTEE